MLLLLQACSTSSSSLRIQAIFTHVNAMQAPIALHKGSRAFSQTTLLKHAQPLLMEYDAAAPAGVNYQLLWDLGPSAAIIIRNQALAISNSNLTGLAGWAPAALSIINSSVLISNSTFQQNTQSQAGAIYINGTSSVDLEGSVIVGNNGSQSGGVFLNGPSTLSINGSVLASNYGALGGAVGFINGTFLAGECIPGENICSAKPRLIRCLTVQEIKAISDCI